MTRDRTWQLPNPAISAVIDSFGRPSRQFLTSLGLLALVGFSGCTTSTSLVRVKDETIGRPQFTKIVVSTPTEDLQIRDYVEGLVAHRLRNETVAAYRAMDVLPPLREYTPLEVAETLESLGADLLLVVAVTDFWQTHYTSPSTTVEKTQSQSSTNISQWGGLLSAKTTGSSTSVSQTIPGITLTQSNVKLDARVFQIDVQSPPRMIWRSNSTTAGDFFVGDSKVMRDAAHKIAIELVADSILKAGRPFSGIIILGGPNHDIVLGELDPWQPGDGSLFDENGKYGKDAKESVWQRESIHASDTSSCSVCNFNATNPPIVVNVDGKVIGRLSISKAFDIGYETDAVRRRLAREICKRKLK